MTDWAIPQDIREFQQSEDIERARMVCATLLASIALVSAGAMLALFTNLLPPELTGVLLRVSIGLAIAYAIAVLVFYRTAGFWLAAHMYASLTFVIYVIHLPRLPVESLQAFLVPIMAIPLFAGAIGGLRVGLPWLLIIAATPAVLSSYWSTVLGRSSEVSPFFIGAWLVLCSSIGFLLWCFEYIAAHMRYRLNEECARFAFDAAHDSLTGLANRAVFARRLSEAIDHARFSHDSLTLLYIDLNDFKPINDKHGHHAGDALLTEVGQRLAAVVRQSDTVARLGGDEFVVLYRHLRRGSHLDQCVARVHQVIADPVMFGTTVLKVSASIGVVCYPDDGDNATVLQQRADALMYEAKQRRKDTA